MSDIEWLEISEENLKSGGFAMIRERAMDLAKSRRNCGGLLPCCYPRVGGGCFVAELDGARVKLRTVYPVTEPKGKQ